MDPMPLRKRDRLDPAFVAIVAGCLLATVSLVRMVVLLSVAAAVTISVMCVLVCCFSIAFARQRWAPAWGILAGGGVLGLACGIASSLEPGIASMLVLSGVGIPTAWLLLAFGSTVRTCPTTTVSPIDSQSAAPVLTHRDAVLFGEGFEADDIELDEEASDEEQESGTLLQSWTRKRFADGDESLEGVVRVTFEPGQRRVQVHLPFVPAFSETPALWCEPHDGEEFAAETDVLHLYGARITVRRRGGVSTGSQTELAIIVSASQSRIADAA